MNRLLLIFLLPLLLLSMGAEVKAADTDPSSKPVQAKHVFGVHGLACPFCAVGIKKIFKKTQGVKSVDVSLKKGLVTVYTEKGMCFSKQDLEKLFKKTGFTYHGTVSQPAGCRRQ